MSDSWLLAIAYYHNFVTLIAIIRVVDKVGWSDMQNETKEERWLHLLLVLNS